ncbi:MAG: hypothetical protein HC853_06020 [Anaerolineae bacterium]|nr:hypothetical protein [Anaerolineae bacterium]
MWQSNHPDAALFVSGNPPSHWYVFSLQGSAACGSLDGTPVDCPTALWRCWLTCKVDFAEGTKPSEPLLLLTQNGPRSGRVYRLGQSRWIHRYLP